MISVRIRRNGDAERVLERIRRGLEGPKHVKVGFPRGSDAEQLEKGVYMEFGTAGSGKGFSTPRGGGFGGPVPERPFLRTTMRTQMPKYKRLLVSEAQKILAGQSEMRRALTRLGTVAEADVKQTIGSNLGPALSPVTIAIKGSTQTLIDSGAMSQSVRWKIEDP